MKSEEQESAVKILERPYDTLVSYPITTKKGKKLGNCRGVRHAGKGLTPQESATDYFFCLVNFVPSSERLYINPF